MGERLALGKWTRRERLRDWLAAVAFVLTCRLHGLDPDRVYLAEEEPDGCVCMEIGSRHCPVHAQEPDNSLPDGAPFPLPPTAQEQER